MRLKTIVFHSELEFRKYVIQNSKEVNRTIVFVDELESCIYFYCFTQRDTMIAAKEPLYKDYTNYQEKYIQIAKEHHFHIVLNSYKIDNIEFINDIQKA